MIAEVKEKCCYFLLTLYHVIINMHGTQKSMFRRMKNLNNFYYSLHFYVTALKSQF